MTSLRRTQGLSIHPSIPVRSTAVVEIRGFEPLTFSLRTRRATNCATAPDASYDARRNGSTRGGGPPNRFGGLSRGGGAARR